MELALLFLPTLEACGAALITHADEILTDDRVGITHECRATPAGVERGWE